MLLATTRRPLSHLARFVYQIPRHPHAITIVPRSSVERRPQFSSMKRASAPTTATSPAKKARIQVPEYHATPPIKEEDGSIQWPAPGAKMKRTREFIREWYELDDSSFVSHHPYMLTDS